MIKGAKRGDAVTFKYPPAPEGIVIKVVKIWDEKLIKVKWDDGTVSAHEPSILVRKK